jgi:hypothetical protein
LAFRSEMGLPHDLLERLVPEQFCDSTQIHSCHNQSTCKSMAVAMPCAPLNRRLFECAGGPIPCSRLLSQPTMSFFLTDSAGHEPNSSTS